MKLGNGVYITEWYDRIAKDQAVEATSTQTYNTTAYNNKAGVVFPVTGADTAQDRFSCGFSNVHSNTDGMMIFIAGKTTTTPRTVLSKEGTSAGTYFWSFGAVSIGIYEDKAAATPAKWSWNSDSPRDWLVGTWAIVAYTWTPGAAPVMYVNKTACDAGAGNPPDTGTVTAVNDIELDDGNDQRLIIGGLKAAAGSPFQGTLGDVIILNKNDATLRTAMFDWLGARWNIAMP
jgi:hypothetical protein